MQILRYGKELRKHKKYSLGTWMVLGMFVLFLFVLMMIMYLCVFLMFLNIIFKVNIYEYS